jgi:hypothetical protein
VVPGYEYMICISQGMKVTFINVEHQGKVVGDQEVVEIRERMYDSCPDLCAFLQRAGADGWDLVSAYALPFPDGVVEKFVFKRPQ